MRQHIVGYYRLRVLGESRVFGWLTEPSLAIIAHAMLSARCRPIGLQHALQFSLGPASAVTRRMVKWNYPINELVQCTCVGGIRTLCPLYSGCI